MLTKQALQVRDVIGTGRPSASKMAAASRYASGEGSHTTSMLVLWKSARVFRMRARPAAPHPMTAALTVGSKVIGISCT